MKFPGDEQAAVDPDLPDAGGGGLKAHENQLAAGAGLGVDVGDGDDRLLQEKADGGVRGEA